MKRKITVALLALLLCITMMPLSELIDNENVYAASVKISHSWPLPNKYNVTSPWLEDGGHKYGPHHGVDFAANTGEPVYATAAGTVEESDYNASGYGNYVFIRHSDGTYSLYGHMSKRCVKAKQKVKQGQKVGEVGNTGNSYGPHLHYGIYLGKKYLNEAKYSAKVGTVDPEKYLSKWMVVSTAVNNNTGKPVLQWTQHPKASSYNIYRKSNSENAFKLVKKHTTARSFVDNSAKPTFGYTYKIKALDKNYDVIKASSKVHQICKIAKPTIKSTASSKGKIRIDFSGEKAANEYKLYYSDSKSGEYIYLFSVKLDKCDKGGESHYFLTSKGADGNTHYYKVQACHSKYTAGNSAQSASASAKYVEEGKNIADKKDVESSTEVKYSDWQSSEPSVVAKEVSADGKTITYKTVEKKNVYKAFSWYCDCKTICWKNSKGTCNVCGKHTDNFLSIYSSVKLNKTGYLHDSSDNSYTLPQTVGKDSPGKFGTVYCMYFGGKKVTSFKTNSPKKHIFVWQSSTDPATIYRVKTTVETLK